MSHPKYVLKAKVRAYRVLRETERYAEGREQTRRRVKRLLDHPEYGKRFAQLDAHDQDRILTRVHSTYTKVSAQKKQKLIFRDIDDTLKRKKGRLAKYKKSRELGIRGGPGTPEELARRYAALNPDTRSEAWPGDWETEAWVQYRRVMGYVA